MRYDLAIIGAGWAGFNAALTGRELGLKTVLIERDLIGGTCLNRGCIPTKVLIQSAKIYTAVKKSGNFGIEVSGAKINFAKIQARKEKIVQQLRQGMEFLLKGIDIIHAEGKIIADNCIEAGRDKIEAENILIASGSSPIELKGFKFDAKKILSSGDILNLKEIPRSLLIIGGGAIGCEFASLFSILGCEVTLAEKLSQLLPGEDSDIAKKLEAAFKKRGIKVNTNTDAAFFNLTDFEHVLVCVGRKPLEKIDVDEYLRTRQTNIYAAGDCAGSIMLAHFAAYQGQIAACNIANPSLPQRCEYTNIPNCIFTYPEVSSIGLKEADARNKGIDIFVSRFDFLGNAMARILDETEGFVKIISDNHTGKVLGASIIGAAATELIANISVAVSSGLSLTQLKNTIFAHPTLSESIHDAIR